VTYYAWRRRKQKKKDENKKEKKKRKKADLPDVETAMTSNWGRCQPEVWTKCDSCPAWR